MAKYKFVSKMAKLVSTGVVFSLLMSATVFGANAVTNGTNINVRSTNSTSGQVLGKLSQNQAIDVLGKNGSFYKVSYNGKTGYISSEFVNVKNTSGIVNASSVNVRSAGYDSAAILGQLDQGKQINLTGRSGEFLAFDYNGKKAFIHTDFVNSDLKNSLPVLAAQKAPSAAKPAAKSAPAAKPIAQAAPVEKTVVVSTPAPAAAPAPAATQTAVIPAEPYAVVEPAILHLKQSASTAADADATLAQGDLLVVLEQGATWSKVKTNDGKIGYVMTDDISIRNGSKTSSSLDSSDSKGAEIVAYAQKFLGTPYVYGGTSLGRGVDCSGFVQSVYKHYGINLNRTSASMPSNGVPVSKSELLPGDLIFFGVNGSQKIGHVGIYMGDNKIIHAASGNPKCVTIDSLSTKYYATNYRKAVRVLR